MEKSEVLNSGMMLWIVLVNYMYFFRTYQFDINLSEWYPILENICVTVISFVNRTLEADISGHWITVGISLIGSRDILCIQWFDPYSNYFNVKAALIQFITQEIFLKIVCIYIFLQFAVKYCYPNICVLFN